MTVTPNPDRAGWFDDPDHAEQLRYFDGIIWTDHTTPRRTVWKRSTDQVGQVGTDASAENQLPSLYAPHQSGSSPPQVPVNPYGVPADPRRQDYRQATGPTTTDGVPLASMGARLGAWAIDVAITWALGLVLGGYFLWRGLGNYPEVIAEAFRNGTPPSEAAALAEQVQFDGTWMGIFAVVQLVIGVGYHSYFLSRTGSTIGKSAAGISVRLADQPGVLSPSDAMRRSMLRPVLFMFLWTPIGLLAAPLSVFDAAAGVWHPTRQTIHDRIGRTVVVRGPQPRGRDTT